MRLFGASRKTSEKTDGSLHVVGGRAHDAAAREAEIRRAKIIPFKPYKSQAVESRRTISPVIFRYVLGEAFFAFFIAFLFFFFIFFVNQILLMSREILTRRVPFDQVALLVLFSLPAIISLSTPFASLVGTLMTVGRLTSDNEILVMLSSGLSYRNIFVPAFVLGTAISLISFFANDVLLPAGTIQFRRLWREILVSTPALELQANSVRRYRDTVIVTGGVSGNIIENVVIMDRTSDGERRVITAARAELSDEGARGFLLHLEGAFVQSAREFARDDFDYATAEALLYWIHHEDLIQGDLGISPREMSSVDVHREIRRRAGDLNWLLEDRRASAVISAMELEGALRAGPGYEDAWNRRAHGLAAFQRDVFIYQEMRVDRGLLIYRLEFYRKFSIPFGAFSFVFLAVSLGFLAKKSGQTIGFIVGLLISVVYWSALVIGQTAGLRLGVSPFWAMWTPNIVAMVAGIALAVARLRK